MVSKAPVVLLLALQFVSLSFGQPIRSNSNACRSGTSPFAAAESCKQVFRCYPGYLSGIYWIKVKSTAAGDTVKQLHCIRATHAGIEGGFLQIASLNTTSQSGSGRMKCPSALQATLTGSPGKEVCAAKSTAPGCTTVRYETFGIPYSVVCGKVVGIVKGSPKAFDATPPGDSSRAHPLSVDGVVITHGSAKKHLWTYAAGVRSATSRAGACPCDEPSQRGGSGGDDDTFPAGAPRSIGSHYYCESVPGDLGSAGRQAAPEWLPDAPLWAGGPCGERGGCCWRSGAPWFCRRLPVETTDHIEVNLCLDGPTEDKNIGLEALELRVY